MDNSKRLTFFFTVLTLLFIVSSSLFLRVGVYGVNNASSSDFQKVDNKGIIGGANSDFTPSSILSESEMQVHTYALNERFEGYQLFIVCRRTVLLDTYDSILVLMDLDGNIIKQKYLGTTTDVAYLPAKFINSTTILYAAPDGAHLWNIATDVDLFLNFKGHHDYDYNPNSNTVFTFNRYKVTLNSIDYYFDYIEEYALNGTKVWSLDTRTFINTSMWCPYHDLVNGVRDITHSNTIFYDAEEDMLYYNPRNVNTFYKIDHNTGQVIWGLGEYGNFTLYDKYGHQKDSLFYHPHSLEKIDDNTFIIFDNDYHNQTDEYSRNSRIVEITINETDMTAWESWTWEGGRSYYSYYWSDADRLPNGNRLGTFGTYEHATDSTYGARIVEVNSQGQIVWQLDFPNTDTYSYGIYRSERVSFVPYIEPSKDLCVPVNRPVTISWQVHSGINERIGSPGYYSIYLNGSLLDEGALILPSFRRGATIDYTFNGLEEGAYNLTLIVKDKTGNQAVSKRLIIVKPFDINRIGPTSVEQNDPEAIISWSGFTSSPLTYELRLNDTIVQSGTWNGEVIEFYAGSLAVGYYYISLLLFNATVNVYNDTFILFVAIEGPPVILSEPADQSIVWNTSLTLAWVISDTNPQYYEIYLDNKLQLTKEWIEQNATIYWNFPTVNEGEHNVTLVAYDAVGNKAKSTVFVSVVSPSPPVVIYTGPTELIWGSSSSYTLTWEVHGGQNYYLWKNGSVYASGIILSNTIAISPIEWYNDEWRPGVYNLTLYVEDVQKQSITITTFIEVKILLSDPYANDYVSAVSLYYSNPSNALGAPDGKYAEIHVDYGNGYLVLDMGENEAITNGEGNDFIVYSAEGNYKVSVSNDLSKPFTDIGFGTCNQSFDLNTVGFSEARYVRIEYQGGELILLDAIEAYHYHEITRDTEPPIIESPGNITIYDNASFLLIEWKASDLTPYEYAIYLNGTSVAQGYWDGSPIEYVLEDFTVGTYELKIELKDVFGNVGTDIIYVRVFHATVKTQKSPIMFGNIIVILAITEILRLLIKKRRKKSESFLFFCKEKH